ncbi:hypothetical protein OUZ56_028393 [Daphnia magna]|uniref:Uncharacterized protein n=1 Tax=Daphnia magna TaxID=35525 RepID=A0ABR0B3Q3_9CRUS|nr:hypothetical protein OUZ56_028393 [Daphnia magna]
MGQWYEHRYGISGDIRQGSWDWFPSPPHKHLEWGTLQGFKRYTVDFLGQMSRILQTTTCPLGKGNLVKDLTDPPSSFQAIAHPLSHDMP